MSKVVGGAAGGVAIGEAAAPPFARLPDAAVHFRQRAQRFAILSEGHKLRPYLRFLAGLAEAQHRAQESLPAPVMPDEARLARAYDFGMPPLDRGHAAGDDALAATMDALFALAPEIEMPEAGRAALRRVTAAGEDEREAMAALLLAGAAPTEAVAEHVYVAAALQLHFTRLAGGLAADRLKPAGEGACPSCGAPPVASAVVGWRGAHGTRFATCSLCATQWHVVRIKCTLCGETAKIGYQAVDEGVGEGTEALVRAETCDACQAYVKVLQQHRNPDLDPVADDVASLALDLLMRQTGYRRGGLNPFLFGY
ncbi:formate dehydrogenase accessory protein FdhE [Phreatobacter sp. AB_2022a]|uniref:formate dehydrogenase accessory protein FdhE n=1 Tax=Phreatobacter sp. AB_2022a TaxID=3003134 RepID=UPI00228724F1|nr:formate dehydrogenase accessory protein FdhE [Phreatobacter sp. AB_2022a]MCZ0737575.1 formate dehydrogenase accessory protein FdhE [Phreatobacter sp. AB_2022a]